MKLGSSQMTVSPSLQKTLLASSMPCWAPETMMRSSSASAAVQPVAQALAQGIAQGRVALGYAVLQGGYRLTAEYLGGEGAYGVDGESLRRRIARGKGYDRRVGRGLENLSYGRRLERGYSVGKFIIHQDDLQRQIGGAAGRPQAENRAVSKYKY
jgi:hypothetical protein